MFFLRSVWKLAVLAGVFGVGFVVGREHSFEEEEEWNRENNSSEADAEPSSAEKNEVEFEFMDPDANSVALVGTFNDWDKEANPMVKDGDVWKCTLELEAGKYEYQFVVNATDWKIDPNSEENVKNKYEGENSVIEIK
jgi:1,4-alpha-glucan branching enzyme